jgi:predicted metal-dependent peptidase
MLLAIVTAATTVAIAAFSLKNEIYQLLTAEPFFAAFSRCINKRESHLIPTAGVRIDDFGYFELIYNSAYLESLPFDQRRGCLMHEFYHCILEHLTTRAPFPLSERSQEVAVLRKIWNYATDLAINSLLPANYVNENWLLPGRNPMHGLKAAEKKNVPEYSKEIADLIESFPKGKESEWYYRELLKVKKNFEQEMKGEGEGGEGEGKPGENGGTGEAQFDDHGEWSGQKEGQANSASEAAKEMAKEVLRDAMEKAAQNAAQSSGWGSVSAEMQKSILERIRGTVDWRKVLRWFCNASIKADRRNSIRKINKRYPYIHSGKVNNRTANIAVSIDQSGSVSNELLSSFYAELDSLSQYVTFTVIPFDSDVGVKDIFTWKKGERRTWERYMCGGTDFNAPTAYVNAHPEFDAHIILTDMCAPKPVSSKRPRIWMTDRANAEHPCFDPRPERLVIITNRKK